MEKPILSLRTRDFLTGIAPSAHTERGGLFFKATGVTSAYDPGGTESVENGLLQASPAPTNIGGATVTGTIWAATSGKIVTSRAFFYDEDGNIYQLLTNGTLSSVHDGDNNAVVDAVTNPRAGLVIYRGKLHYWRSSNIGTYDGTTWNDTAYSVTGTTPKYCSPHVLFDRAYFIGNSGTYLSQLDGTTVTNNVLDWDSGHIGTAISDDGVYLAVAVCENVEADNVFSMCRVLFWDTSSSSWQREYVIRDPFIWSLKRVGNSVFAFGQYGIYEVSFGGGVTKVLSRLIGFGTPADLTSGYGSYRADVYNQSALLFGTDTTIDTFGSLAPDLSSSYQKTFKVPAAVGTPTCVFSRFAVGSVYVATDGDKLYRYDYNGATHETSVSAQTVYFPLPTKMEITRVDVVFGEPLVTGDAMSIQFKSDEDTAVEPTTALTATYAADGAIRRKKIRPNGVTVEDQLSVLINFTTGSVKIKRVDIFASPIPL